MPSRGLGERDQAFALIELNIESQFSRWVHEVTEALKRASISVDEYGSVGTIVELHPADTHRLSPVRLVPAHWSDRKGLCAYLDQSISNWPEQAAIWQSAFASAERSLKNELSEIVWTAVVGPDPMNGGDSAKTINSPKIVGSMSLLSPVEMMTEFVPCLHPGQIAAREYVYSWPVPVQGTMLTFNDRVVPGSVHRNLALLAALLSVVFEVPWIVRQQPFAFLGDISPLIAASRENVPSHQNGPEHPQETELPTWVFEGWDRSNADRALRNAVLTHSEALRLTDHHPSFALVAFMAVFQALGSRIEKRENKQREAALRQILSSIESKEILRLYGNRSDTAHQGVLFGSEIVAGMSSHEFNPYWEPPEQLFQRESLRKVKRVSQELIVRHLQADQMFGKSASGSGKHCEE